MKKKLLSLLLASTMALTVCGGLAACGDKDKGTGGGAAGLTPSEFNKVTNLDDPLANKDGETNDKVAACELKVWGPEELRSFYTGLFTTFKSDSYHGGKYSNVTITYEAMEEGNTLTNLETDPSAGADVFFFASDHAATMISKNYLAPLRGATGSYYSAAVTQRDGAGNVSSVTKDGYAYAFPATNDNGYFLVYDKEKLNETQVQKLDDILAVANTENASFMFRYGTGFYAATFFFGEGLGCDARGADSDFSEYGSDAAERGAKATIKYINSGYCQDGTTPKIIDIGDNGASVDGIKNGTLIAGVCGIWEAPAAADLTKIGCTKLPTFTSTDGTQKQMGAFFGGKYCGVNARSANSNVAMALANFMTNGAAQQARFEEAQTGPSNKTVAERPEVKANAALAALGAQVAACGVAQGNVPQSWWSGWETYIDDIEAGNVTEANPKLADLVSLLTPTIA